MNKPNMPDKEPGMFHTSYSNLFSSKERYLCSLKTNSLHGSYSDIGLKLRILLVFMHNYWIPFQCKVRMRINLLGVAR